MSVRNHRICAGTILLCASLGLVAVGRTLVADPPAVVQARTQLDGRWVATRIEVSRLVAVEGDQARQTQVEFAGDQVRFEGLVDLGTTTGVYQINPSTTPGKIDFKLTAGWMLGAYEQVGDRLTLCVNALQLSEQLGVPARGRPTGLHQGPGRFVYEFRRAAP